VKFAPELSPFPQPELSAATLSGGQFSFNLTGVPGFDYVIESSTNLVNWVPVETNVAPFTFTLTNAVTSPDEFFRSVRN
jgi:hypothetical protein